MDIANVENTMSGTPWLAIVGAVFGTLIATIGSLVLARLVNVSHQIDKNREEYKKEFTAIWETIKTGEGRCAAMHSTIAQDIGFIKAKLEDILTTLAEQKKDLWEKADRQTSLLMSEKEGIRKELSDLRQELKEVQKDMRNQK